MRGEIFVITGPPGAGKTTLCEALLRRFEFGFHLPVDDLRLWVKQGLSESVPWTEETERQFQIAEAATADVAKCYSEAGFTVAIDHCRNIPRLDALIAEHLSGFRVVRVCLLPDLTTNLERNRARTNKPFDPEILTETIQFVSGAYEAADRSQWLTVDNRLLSVEETVQQIVNYASGKE
ncbi:MAG: AAA family ATPase [Fimbriimonas sp.]